MKRNFTLLKRVFLLLLSVFIVALINSCKQEIKTSSSLSNGQKDPLVDIAKNWFEATYSGSNSPADQTTFGTEKNFRKWSNGLKPNWNAASTYQKYGQATMELPLFNSDIAFAIGATNAEQVKQTNNYTKTSYLLSRDSAGKFNAWLMVLVADSSYIANDFTKLSKNSYKQRDPNYSGRLLYFTPKGEFLAGWRYERGAITKTISLSDYKEPVKQVAANGVNLVQTCTTIPITTVTWECITVDFNNSGPQTNCTAHYNYSFETSCTTTGGSGGGGGGGGGGTGPSNPPTPCVPQAVATLDANTIRVNVVQPPDGGFPPPPAPPVPCPPAQKIENNITNDCLKNAVNDAIQKGLKTFTSEMTNSLFGSDEGFDLVMEQSATFSNNVDAVTQQINAATIEIRFNSNVLPTSSKEYIAATTMHEALHGMMDAMGNRNEFKQHTGMANNYVTIMANDLQTMFPGLSHDDATAMAWGGLGDTQAWQNLVTSDPVKAQNIINANKAYKDANGGKGKRC